MNELKKIQRILEFQSSPTLLKWESKLKYDIEEVLAHEGILWFQKSKAEWLKHGDRNTSYFHSRTLTRRKRNKIASLVVDSEWCFEEERLK